MTNNAANRTKVAVVILNWNGKSLLEKFLPSVTQYSKGDGFRVYVADNGSSDDSLNFLAHFYPDVEVIKLDKNYGFAGGYNKAFEQIDAEYAVLLNSDVEVTENWLSPIVHFLDEHHDVAAVQPKILSYYNKAYFEYAGACGGFIDKYGFPFCRGRILDTIEKDCGQYDDICDVFWASGACLFVRLDLYKEIGGLDADFFAHMEEIDLCFRLKNAGHRIVCYPFSTVYHVGGGTLKNDSPKKFYLNYRNNLLMLYKNISKRQFKQLFGKRILIDCLAFITLLMKGKFKFSFFEIKAYRDFFKMKKNYAKLHLNESEKAPFKEQYKKSIIFQYYLKKKSNFLDL